MILHKEIQRLKRQLAALTALVESRLTMAIKAVQLRESDLAKQVIDGDYEIDDLEVDLEEECLKVLALHQPVAIDLRVIIATLKINNDLERIGDLTVEIAERGRYFATCPPLDLPFDFPTMAKKVQEMLQKSFDAFVHLDPELAQEVCASDDIVDEMHRKMFQTVGEFIRNYPENTKYYLSSMTISRCLERIADHSTNIAEDVIYMIKGNVVRHSGDIY